MRAIYARDIILNNVNLKASSSPNVHFKITIFPRDLSDILLTQQAF